MSIFIEFMVSDAQLRALQAADDKGIIRPARGITWRTLEAMARQDRGWVVLHPSGERKALITVRGQAMIEIGKRERERKASRKPHTSLASRVENPFSLFRSA